jgi:tRNA (guanine37-N1)-methyltransferase
MAPGPLMSDSPFHFDVITLFPGLLDSYLSDSIIGRAIQSGRIEVTTTNPREFTLDRHRKVDDTPYGGGAGMVMMAEPLGQAIDSVRSARPASRLVMLSPSGRLLSQAVVEEYAALGSLVLICGRYEGVDARIVDHVVDECLSIGDYVLTGGELGALTVIDAVSRQLPGVLGNAEGPLDESFANEALLEHPQYTRPRTWRGHEVPEVLLSGNHGAIAEWRSEERIARTATLRPDLITRWAGDDAKRLARVKRSRQE